MRMMVTLDESEFAEAAIGPAARLAKDAKAQVYLVQVVELGRIRSTSGYGPETAAEAVRAEFTGEGAHIPRATAARTPEPRAAESLGQALDRAVQASKDYLQTLAGPFAPWSQSWWPWWGRRGRRASQVRQDPPD